MQEAKRTPGPWEFVIKDDKYGREPLIVGPETPDGDCPVVCGAFSFANDGILAAAAPELLGACNALLGLFLLLANRNDLTPELQDVLSSNHSIIEARAAIAKATASEAA